jgi:hypothetical protein
MLDLLSMPMVTSLILKVGKPEQHSYMNITAAIIFTAIVIFTIVITSYIERFLKRNE